MAFLSAYVTAASGADSETSVHMTGATFEASTGEMGATVADEAVPSGAGPVYLVTALSLCKALLLAVTALLVVLGNGMSLVVLLRTRDGVSPVTRLFLISLTTSDLLVGLLVCLPIVGSTAVQAWPYGDAYCSLVAACHVLYFNAGLSVMAINVERYIAVIWPLRYPNIVTLRRAAVVEAVFLALLLTWTALYVFPGERVAFYYTNFSQCYIDPVEGSDFTGHVGMSVFIAAPLFITVVLHVRLYFLASDHASRVADVSVGQIRPGGAVPVVGADDRGGRRAGRPARFWRRLRRRPRPAVAAETRAARTFFLMAAVLTVSWVPYYTTIAWENLRADKLPAGVAFASQLLLLFNSFWNVVIYYSRNLHFRRTANRLFGCCLPVRFHQLPEHST